MIHSEYLFLRFRAGAMREAMRRAAAEGETFHPMTPYTPLQSTLEAVAFPRDGLLVLRLRCREDLRPLLEGKILLAFHAFFPGGHARAPARVEGGYVVEEANAPYEDTDDPTPTAPRVVDRVAPVPRGSNHDG